MNSISFKPVIISASIGLLTLFSCLSTEAQTRLSTIELKVHSENEQKQSCPDRVIVTEKPRPYQEGSFATDGSVNLSLYASNISIATSHSFSVTWMGILKPKYANCLASAGITKVDGEEYSGHTNYLRMHFVKGRVYFILDLAGEFDPNDYPLSILKSSLKSGNPVWTWGGTD